VDVADWEFYSRVTEKSGRSSKKVRSYSGGNEVMILRGKGKTSAGGIVLTKVGGLVEVAKNIKRGLWGGTGRDLWPLRSSTTKGNSMLEEKNDMNANRR